MCSHVSFQDASYKHTECEDLRIILEWSYCVQRTILQYGILNDDIYNFDKTGFAMELIETAKVITSLEYYS